MVDIHSNHPLEPGGRTKTFVDMASPQTRWRDGLCDCFKYGILHPMVLNSFICPHGKIFLFEVIACYTIDH
jgi:hypothetical protein